MTMYNIVYNSMLCIVFSSQQFYMIVLVSLASPLNFNLQMLLWALGTTSSYNILMWFVYEYLQSKSYTWNYAMTRC